MTNRTKNNKEQQIGLAIREIIGSLMDKVMDNVLVKKPFIKEEHYCNRPLYAALVPDEIFKGSHFERRFVTAFGSVWEQLALAVARVYHGECTQGSTIEGTIGEERLKRIQEVLNRLEHPLAKTKRQKPNWEEELAHILKGGGDAIPVSVTCDILVRSSITKETYAFELKAPLPNSDQTKVSKEKMFKLLAMNEGLVDKAFYALVYNPYGKRREDYAWSYPKRWFDMQQDSSVLIGEEFWDFIGGAGIYEYFIQEINKLGQEYKDRIYLEYWGIEPPKDEGGVRLK